MSCGRHSFVALAMTGKAVMLFVSVKLRDPGFAGRRRSGLLQQLQMQLRLSQHLL